MVTARLPAGRHLPNTHDRRRTTEGVDLPTVSSKDRARKDSQDQAPTVAKAALMTGGSFASVIGAILGASGMWGLGNWTVLSALVALCVIVAITMFTAALLMRS